MKLGPLQLDIPDTWEDRSLYTFIAPPARVQMGPTVAEPRGFRTNVVITNKPAGAERTLDQAVKDLEARTKRDFGELPVTVDDPGTVSGNASRRLRYVVNDPSGRSLPIAQVIWVFLAGGSEWTVTFSVASLELKEQLPSFEAMMRSLRYAA